MTLIINQHSKSVNNTVNLTVGSVTLGSGSVEQAVQDCHQATVSLIAVCPGQSSLNLLQDNLVKQVSIKRQRFYPGMTAKS
jgi:hypothetical protein